jgi:NADH-quinone oxidoreductase subunit G
VTPKGKEITVLIDGREVSATEGELLRDAAARGDVEIPVFCYEPKLGDPVGACRMCLVEIEGMPKLQTSCSTPVRDGMVIHTRTDQVKQAQSAVVEFLLVNHPLDCPVCDKGGECPLQDITMGWGPGKSRVIDRKRHFQKPVELSPLVAIDRERCILCYRCVRFSQEVSEDSQLQLLERGDRTFVGTFDDRPYVNPFHGNITDLCPVGALTSYTYRFRARPWDIEQAGSVCTLCPSQCNLSFTVRDEQVKRVVSRDNPDVDDGWLCDRGRYGFEMFAAEERVTEPRLRGGPASWDEAIAKAAEGLRRAAEWTVDPPHRGSNRPTARVAAIVGDASNEEGYLVQRIVREALGSPHVESRPAGGPGRETLVRLAQPELSARVRDIDDAEAILVVGSDPLHTSPILDLRIRKAMRRNGARLALATDRPTSLDGGAEAVTRYAPGEADAFLAELARALRQDAGEGDGGSADAAGGSGGERSEAEGGSAGQSAGGAAGSGEGVDGGRGRGEAGGGSAEPAAEVADVLRSAERVVVIWGERIGRDGEDATAALLDVAGTLDLAGKDGSGLMEIPDAANARGLREAGCLPDAGPGLGEPVVAVGGGAASADASVASNAAPAVGMDSEEIRAALESGELESLILFGVDPLRDFPDTAAWDRALTSAKHLIVFSTFENATTAKADVVFPLETHAEKDGTVTHPDGRLQRVRPSASRPGDIRPNWGVLAELSQALGHDTGVDSQPSAFAALTEAVPFYAGIADADIAGRGIRWQETDAASLLPAPAESVESGATGTPSSLATRRSGVGGLPPEAHSSSRAKRSEGVPASPLRLGTYRDIWAGPIAELNPPLKFMRPEQRVELSPADAKRMDLASGDEVTVAQDGVSVRARVAIRERMEDGVCFLIEGVAEENANRLLNGGPVSVTIEKAQS